MTQHHTHADVHNPQGSPLATQATVESPVSFQGAGLFTAQRAEVTLNPAGPDHGITFTRTDTNPAVTIPADIDHVRPSPRRTTIAKGDTSVQTVEHLMAALAGLGVTNCDVRIDGPEVPILDGSARCFAEGIADAGVASQDATVQRVAPPAPITDICRTAARLAPG